MVWVREVVVYSPSEVLLSGGAAAEVVAAVQSVVEAVVAETWQLSLVLHV